MPGNSLCVSCSNTGCGTVAVTSTKRADAGADSRIAESCSENADSSPEDTTPTC